MVAAKRNRFGVRLTLVTSVRTGERPPRPRLTILVKLLVAFAVPTSILFGGFAWIAYDEARSDLEAELGTRLAGIAAAAATQIRGRHLVELEAGDEDDRAYQYNLRKLETVVHDTKLARAYVFDRDFIVKVATSPDSPLGSEHFYAQIHRAEIQRVFDRGESVSTVLFTGQDGKQYLAGYAPVRASEDDPEIVLALGVDAAPTYFDRLAELRRSLLLYGLLLVAVVIVIAVFVAALITRPVRALATAAERIGRGELAPPIERLSRDEIGLLAATMDRMRRELRARDERMQMMLAGVAHEVRNPLGGMRLFTGILREELDGDAEKLGHVGRLDKELGYLDTVVNQFLDYARRPPLELGRVDLRDLAEQVAELEAADAEASGVALEVDGESAVARADPGQLRRALFNLVQNAVEAAGEGGGVTLDVAAEADEAVIRVANTGEPIPADVRERIFEPFFTTKEKGTGLGLAFTREIIADHGGSIDADDGAVGAVFTIRLPRAQ